MSSGSEQEQEKRVLRRSTRTKRTVIPVGGNSGEESEGSEVVESEQGSEYSFGTFSETAYKDYAFEDERGPKVVNMKQQGLLVVVKRRETE